MATKRKAKSNQLCELCLRARDDPHVMNPAHVGHPVTGELGLYDIHGMGLCRFCQAKWQRVRNKVTLVG